MRIDSVRVENFKAIRGVKEFELPTGIIGIVGSNGQGKSNLTRAIAWALYGPLVFEKGMNSADVISWGESSTTVDLNLSIAGEQYVLTRSQSSSGSTAHLTGPIEAHGSEAVTKAVADLLAIDRVGFLASTFSRQKDLEGLASLTGPDRTKTVLRLRGLDQITKGIDKVGEEGRESKKALAAIRSALPNPRPIPEYDGMLRELGKELEIAEGRLQELKSRKRDLEAEVTSIVQEQNSLASNRQAFLDYVSKKASARSDLQNALNALEKAKVLANNDKPLRPTAPGVTGNREKLKKLLAKQAEDREFIRSLKTTIDAETSCPTCMRPYDDADQLAKAKSAALKQHAATTERIAKRSVDIEREEQAIKSEEAYENLMVKYDRELGAWEERQRAVEAAEKAAHDAEAILADLDPVKDVTPAYDALTERLRALQNERTNVASYEATKAANVESLNDRIARTKEERAVAKEMVAKVGGLEKRALEYEVSANLLKEFKKQQTSALIPAITGRASDLLSRMTDGKYSELILTPEWDIQYRYDDGELKAFANLSVGERNTFALALRLALAELGSVGLLVLDEVLDALDEDRQNLTWETLESLLGRYEQIIVITHVAAFKERAPYLISL